MNRQIQIVALGVAALVLGGGGFVAGMTVGPSLSGPPAATASPDVAAQGRRAAAGGLAGGAGAALGAGGQVGGRVISVGTDSITLEMRQPGGETARSVIALVGSSTRLVRTVETEIKLGDIKAGDQVLVVGQADQATGTVSANAIVVGVSALQQLFGGGQAPAGGRVRPGASPSPTGR